MAFPGAGGANAASSAGVSAPSSASLPFLGASPSRRLDSERNRAPSDAAPSDFSEFSSWKDDASSSYATFCGGPRDRTITVNTQRMRMGEHLKGKLEDMMKQRFENYLRIIQTLQNDTGKLASLECELAAERPADRPSSPSRRRLSPARISIACNEDGSFLVYVSPDSYATGAAAGDGGGLGEAYSSCSQELFSPSAAAASSDVATPAAEPSDAACGEAAQLSGDASPPAPPSPGGSADRLRNWVDQVCEFGMSGRCHSITALFHFGYDAWKRQLGCSGASWSLPKRTDSWSQIAEEEERPLPAGLAGDSLGAALPPAAAEDSEPPFEPPQPPAEDDPCSADSSLPAKPLAKPPVPAEPEEAKMAEADEVIHRDARSLGSILKAVDVAVDRELYPQAVDLCTEGIELAKERRKAAGGQYGDAGDAEAGDADAALPVLLLLRAKVRVQLRDFGEAQADAEDLITVQPTCAEGYYWRSVALQGRGQNQEALEALMSALEYDPQNSLFQQLFTSLFEEVSSSAASPPSAVLPAPPAEVLRGRREPRGRHVGDALSITTQASHLSSRSTTPTEVSAPQSRSSSNGSLYHEDADPASPT